MIATKAARPATKTIYTLEVVGWWTKGDYKSLNTNAVANPRKLTDFVKLTEYPTFEAAARIAQAIGPREVGGIAPLVQVVEREVDASYTLPTLD